MSVIPLETKRRIIEADARIVKLESLLKTWIVYCDQAGEGRDFSELNPVHVLLRDTRKALGLAIPKRWTRADEEIARAMNARNNPDQPAD